MRRNESFLSPPEVAERTGKGCDSVLRWIKSGQLRAFNLSDGNERPRWRVDPDDLSAFLATRSNHTTASPKQEYRQIPKAKKQHV